LIDKAGTMNKKARAGAFRLFFYARTSDTHCDKINPSGKARDGIFFRAARGGCDPPQAEFAYRARIRSTIARINSASAHSSAANTIASFIIVVNAITPFRGDGGTTFPMTILPKRAQRQRRCRPSLRRDTIFPYHVR
jgi:hypothetical protein